jgi:hypothetical protein
MRKALLAALLTSFLLLANEWMPCGQWNACGILQTDILSLRGEKCRFKLNVRGDKAFQAILYSAENRRVQTLARLSDGFPHGKSTVSAQLPPRIKRGFLRFEGAKFSWDAVFEQYLADVDRWELLQEAKKTEEYLPFGNWCGEEPTEKEVRISIPSTHWKITAKTAEGGRLRVELTTPDGVCLYRDNLFSQNTERVSWGHQKGDFILKISAEGPWSVAIEMN